MDKLLHYHLNPKLPSYAKGNGQSNFVIQEAWQEAASARLANVLSSPAASIPQQQVSNNDMIPLSDGCQVSVGTAIAL